MENNMAGSGALKKSMTKRNRSGRENDEKDHQGIKTGYRAGSFSVVP
jgi:hypothetical protein